MNKCTKVEKGESLMAGDKLFCCIDEQTGEVTVRKAATLSECNAVAGENLSGPAVVFINGQIFNA